MNNYIAAVFSKGNSTESVSPSPESTESVTPSPESTESVTPSPESTENAAPPPESTEAVTPADPSPESESQVQKDQSPESDQPVVTLEPSETPGSQTLQSAPAQEGFLKNPSLIGAVIAGILLIAVLILLFARRLKLGRSKKTGNGGAPMQGFLNGSFRIGNVQHIGQRETQQDSFGLSDLSNVAQYQEKGIFAIVADGMGGLANGAEVSALVSRSMLGYFSSRPFAADPSQELLNMLSHANSEVNAYLRNCKDKSGSTVVAVIIKEKRLHWVSVGDSRICLVRNGALIQVNREHTYASELDEKAAKGEISYEKAMNDPQRNALTSYIGMGELEKIDRSLRPLQLAVGDRILLMSDGIFGTLSDEEILGTMSLSPHEASMALENLVLSKHRKGQDNFTAIIIECF